MKVAVVHDWLITIGGAEKVLKEILTVYPDADVYCLLDYFDDHNRARILNGKTTRVSYLQNIPFARKRYRMLIPFLYKSVQRFDLSKYDLVISSSHAVAKGVKTRKDQPHFSYCHTPVRYVWNMKKTYLKQIPKQARRLAGRQLNKMQKWDLATAKQVDYFIANSKFVANRIEKNYSRESRVINPPVDVDFYKLPNAQDDAPTEKPYFLVVSRLVHYKRVELIIEAFNSMPSHKLVVVGEGPQDEMLRELAGSNIEFTGFLRSKEMRHFMQHAEAMVLAAIEDFGITSLEAQACGTPVIAFDFGGYRETVDHLKSGILYPAQTMDSIVWGVNEFLQNREKFIPENIRQNAVRFGPERFREEFSNFIREKLDTPCLAE